MERLPLFLSFCALIVWSLIALFFGGTAGDQRSRIAARSLGLGLALVQMSGAIWGAARIFSDLPVTWKGIWFSTSSSEAFSLAFSMDAVTVMFWLALSIILAVLAYFSFLNQIKNERTQPRGEAVSTPLLAAGALLVLSAGNFLSYYFGWALVSAMGFLTISFSAPTRDDRAHASFRYLTLNILPESVFVAGIMGCYATIGSLDFSEINAHASSGVPAWAIMCLLVGTMMRNMQIPFMQSARYAASCKAGAYPIYFFAHTLLSSMLFAKIAPALAATEGVQYFAAIPALTAIAAAVLALPEQEPAMIVGWLSSYVCASVFVSGISGGYQAAQSLALTGSLGTFLLAAALTEFDPGDVSARWFIALGALILGGVPFSAWAWARYLEYLGLIHADNAVPALHWFVVGMKILSDLVVGIVLWALVRERWLAFKKQASARLKWDVIVPLSLLVIGNLSVVIGGRPVGGVLGQACFELFSGSGWFEKLLIAPAGEIKPPPSPQELIGSDSDITARILLIGVLLLPVLCAAIWLFREKHALEEFRAFCKRVVQRAVRFGGADSVMWGRLIRPASISIGRLSAFFDAKVLDKIFGELWYFPARAIKRSIHFVEENILDRRLVDGLAVAVATLGKSLRLIQNGQVQFYFALGLVLMGAIVVKFILVGG